MNNIDKNKDGSRVDKMKIAFFVNTPAHAHFYRNIIKRLEEKGHKILVMAREYGETIPVLNGFDINHFIFTKASKSKYVKSLFFPLDVLFAYKFLRRFKPDLIVGHAFYSVYVSKLLRKPSIIFNDNDFAPIQFITVSPFTNVIITPKNFRRKLGDNHIRIDSYKELAYLHPRYFKPNKDIFDLLGISPDENFVLIRFNALDAAHDVGLKTFSLDEKKKLISGLKKYARVFISSEGSLQDRLEQYSLKVPKCRIHDVLHYAQMVVTETGTITTEGAVLGTPAIVCNSKLNTCGNFLELSKYGLLFPYRDSNKAIEKAIELIQEPNLKEEWKKRRERLLKDKIDMTEFMVWFIENYPQSFKEMKENPDIQYKFK